MIQWTLFVDFVKYTADLSLSDEERGPSKPRLQSSSQEAAIQIMTISPLPILFLIFILEVIQIIPKNHVLNSFLR